MIGQDGAGQTEQDWTVQIYNMTGEGRTGEERELKLYFPQPLVAKSLH